MVTASFSNSKGKRDGLHTVLSKFQYSFLPG